MKKIVPLIFSVFFAVGLYGQSSGGWGICEFSTLATMNAFDPSGSSMACKKAFVQATDEHYRWNGTMWVLETSGSATSENIYNTSDTLTADRLVTLDGNDLTFEGTNDVVITSAGRVGINTASPSQDLDVNGIANVEDRLYVGPNAGTSSSTTARIATNFSTDAFTYQLYSRATVTSPTLTVDRTSYGAYFDIINNKTEDTGNGFDSDANAGFFQASTSGSNTFRNLYGVRGYAQNSSSASSNLGTLYGGYFRAYNASTTATVSNIYGTYSQARGKTGTAGNITTAFGSRAETRPFNTAITNAYGIYGYVATNNSYSGDITNAIGVYGRVNVDSDDGGNITTGKAGYFYTDKRSGANVMTTVYGVDIDANEGQTVYGLRVQADDSDATTNYGIYIDADGASTDNYGIFAEDGDWILDEDGDGIPGGTGPGGDLILGASRDLEIYHDGTDSYIVNNKGDLYITDDGIDDVIISTNGGSLGVGTNTPNAKLDVEGGTVRLSEYGGGTYDSGNETYILGVETDGDVVEIDPSSLGSSANIYNSDGTLTAERTVTMGANDMEFDMTGSGDFLVLDNGTVTLAVENSNVGIGEEFPDATLHIVETTGTGASANDGTILLEHDDSGGESSIVFRSRVNAGSDYGYIEYSDNGSGNTGSTENALLSIGTQNDGPGIYQDDIAILPSGNLGVGTISPDARLDVEGGSVRFSDYGGSTYIDTAATSTPATSVYTLGVEADGDIVSVNNVKSSKIFYPPAIAVEVSLTGTDFTLDLHARYAALFATPAVASTNAPTSIPSYAQDELFYYVTDFDTDIFSNLEIDANGLLTYDVDQVPTDNCAILNVVFVVK